MTGSRSLRENPKHASILHETNWRVLCCASSTNTTWKFSRGDGKCGERITDLQIRAAIHHVESQMAHRRYSHAAIERNMP